MIDLAAQHQIRIIAISDHDNIAAIDEATALGRKHKILVIPAVELSASFHGVDVHLLAYAFDHHDVRLQARLAHFRRGRLERGHRMVEKLIAGGCPIRSERVLELCGTGSLGRPHIARALMEAGVVRSIDQAFVEWLSPGCPGYVEKERLSAEEAIEMAHTAGGLISVAHPTLYPDSQRIVEELFDRGADAVEAIHPEVDARSRAALEDLAQKRGKFVTGGSDDHGFEDRRTIGSIRVPESLISPLLDRA